MNAFIQNLATHPMLEVIGWSLVHFVWQAIAIALPVALILLCLSRRPARFRYLVACSGMALMAIAPAVTALYVARTIDPARWAFSSDLPKIAETPNLSAETRAIAANGLAFDPGELPSQDAVSLSAPGDPLLTAASASWSTTLSRWFPALVAIWIGGVLALSARLVCGLWRVGQWKRSGQKVTDKQLLEIGNRLAIRLGMKGRFSLLESARIKVPAVIGWLKPALIVPVGFACGTPPAELESLLAHEMAHIRRHDWLVNLFQSVAETVLFFHPAIWWISSVIRQEREHCCDDIAIEACGDRIAFAKALARLEESRCDSRLAMSASGSSLVLRVRRILAVDEKRLSVRWPAGLVSLAAVGLFVLSLWATRSIAMDTVADPAAEPDNSSTPANVDLPGVEENNKEDWPVHQPEVDRINERTGQTHHVLAGIRMTAAGKQEVRNDMMYSSVMNYTFIPASIVKELGAEELGEIDFGDPPAQTLAPMVPLSNLVPLPPGASSSDNKKDSPQVEFVYVDQLTGPAGEKKIVPYEGQVIHIPDHLAFYGVNRTGQKKFRVVRIEKVNLGLGPEFGPVNALVLDDDNSTIGVLGSNWARVPHGPKGESFVHAAVGGFYFMAIEPPQQENTPATGNANPDDRVIATHTYDTSRRESTGWIDMNGVQVPVDAGVEHDGIKVYVSLMWDVVAVDTKTGKTLWSVPWSKADPIWQTISIIDTKKTVTGLIVEVVGSNGLRLRLDFRSGRVIERSILPNEPSGQHLNYHSGNAPEIDVVQRDGERVVAAMLANPGSRRSPENLVKRFQLVLERTPHPGPGHWVTDEESLVSSEQPRYVLNDPSMTAMDADAVTFNLPEGSEMRAEFAGRNVSMESAGDVTTVTITGGRVRLIDAGGVCRAEASADGGADLLIVECRRMDEEYSLHLKTGWSNPELGSGLTPVQVKLFLSTGAPAGEEQPPHRAVRYRIDHDAANPGAPMAMKMCWHYDLSRLVEEVRRETGKSVEEILYFGGFGGEGPPPSQTFGSPDDGEMQPFPQTTTIEGSEPAAEETPWGAVAENSGLQSRLTLQTAAPTVGQPLLFRLELRNSGDKPTEYDPQNYAAFRVVRATRIDGKAVPFIGQTPQTSSQPVRLPPGETSVLWEDVDVTRLFAVEEGINKFFAEGGEWAAQTLWRDSNTVEVDVQPGFPDPRTSLMGSLARLEVLPENWRVSADDRFVYLTHTPTGLKQDISTIRLWFQANRFHDAFVPEVPGDYPSKPGVATEISWVCSCEAGHLYAVAPAQVTELWPDYLRDIQIAAARAMSFSTKPDAPANREENDEGSADDAPVNMPWRATGRVTDSGGKPFPGVEVRAHTGIGSLRNSGTTTTGADGRYVLDFGPGIWSENRQMVQAATISVSLEGFTEQNMHRQGDKVAALEKPDGEIGWGKTEDDLFLPGKPLEIDFVMAPATKLQGIILDERGDKLEGMKVSLTGKDLPPSSSVVARTATDKGGRFEFTNIPAGYPFQILVEPSKPRSPWLAWASPPMTFRHVSEDGSTHIDYGFDGKTVDFSFQQLMTVIHGHGVNWKSALSDSAEKPLELKWDGLSTDNQISAGMATLELGK
jgi:beta-lactamase regulating signal transducer with metallopeptidase domain